MESGFKLVFWRSSQDGHLCIDRPCTSESLLVIGNFTGDEDMLDILKLAELQETGLDSDQYGEVIPDEGRLSTDEKRALLNEKKNEKPLYYLGDIYKGITIYSVREFMEKMLTYYENGRVFSTSCFAPLLTPLEFNYTGVCLINNPYQGVLHTFLRHYLHWEILIPLTEVRLQRLRPLHIYIELIAKAQNIKTSRVAIANFVQALSSLDKQDFNECQTALNEIQMTIVKHLQNKLTYPNYRGEGLNDKSQMEVYFRIHEGLVIVMGFSRELFKPEVLVLNSRPIRALITAYFIDPEEQSKRMIMKSY